MLISYGRSHYYDVYGVVVEGTFTSQQDAATIIEFALTMGGESCEGCLPDEPANLVINFLTLAQREGQEPDFEAYSTEAVEMIVRKEIDCQYQMSSQGTSVDG